MSPFWHQKQNPEIGNANEFPGNFPGEIRVNFIITLMSLVYFSLEELNYEKYWIILSCHKAFLT